MQGGHRPPVSYKLDESEMKIIDQLCGKQEFEDRLMTFDQNNKDGTQKLKLDTSRSFSTSPVTKDISKNQNIPKTTTNLTCVQMDSSDTAFKTCAIGPQPPSISEEIPIHTEDNGNNVQVSIAEGSVAKAAEVENTSPKTVNSDDQPVPAAPADILTVVSPKNSPENVLSGLGQKISTTEESSAESVSQPVQKDKISQNEQGSKSEKNDHPSGSTNVQKYFDNAFSKNTDKVMTSVPGFGMSSPIGGGGLFMG